MLYVDYKCRCPGCGYTYTISTYELPRYERCPICGHSGDFKEFSLQAKTVSELIKQAEAIFVTK